MREVSNVLSRFDVKDRKDFSLSYSYRYFLSQEKQKVCTMIVSFVSEITLKHFFPILH